ncbi:MAG TPA: tripartite tricarboxylate transporter substrate binding protein [Burkholderiales bacterium]|nr:tripartite tricarboxylate transporter substrate binding protein [Burkholderiales bacterium]
MRPNPIGRRPLPVLLACVAFALSGAQQPVSAQAFPAKAVRIVIPFAAGGSADLQARTLGQKLAEIWGQSVLVDPRPGAGTTIGAAHAAASPADGYTLYFAGASLLISGNLYKNLSYDAVTSFAPVSMVANSPYFLVVHPSVPAATVKALIALAKSKPKSLSYASAGTGSGSHLAGELFRMQTGTDLVHVPYKGQAPALLALAGGEVGVLFADVAAVPYVQAGRMRALAVTADRRSAVLPAVPTIGEAGLPGYQMSNWGAILVPAGTPKPLIAQINAAIVQALADADVRQRFAGQGFDAMSSTPEALGSLLAAENAKYARVIKQSGMKIE